MCGIPTGPQLDAWKKSHRASRTMPELTLETLKVVRARIGYIGFLAQHALRRYPEHDPGRIVIQWGDMKDILEASDALLRELPDPEVGDVA